MAHIMDCSSAFICTTEMSGIACNSQPFHDDYFGSRPKRNDVINTFHELWKL